MSEYTARANIKNFKAQLLTSSDEVQKATLRNLLREEMQLLTELSPTDTELSRRLGESTYICAQGSSA